MSLNSLGFPALCIIRDESKIRYDPASPVKSFSSSKTGTLDINYPDIASQWDFVKNESIPNDFPLGSKEKVWWICSKVL